jgi:hypothetical protein
VRKNIWAALAQETEKQDQQKTFNIIDDKALGDNVRSVTLYFSAQDEKTEDNVAGKFDVGIFWTEADKPEYAASFASSEKAKEKFDSLNEQLKELEGLASKKDPSAQEKTKDFFEKIKSTEAHPPTEPSTEPITRTQADQNGWTLRFISGKKSFIVVSDGTLQYIVPPEYLKLFGSDQAENNATLDSYNEQARGFNIKSIDGRESMINDEENIVKLAKVFGWDGADLESAIAYLQLHLGEGFDDQGYFATLPKADQ